MNERIKELALQATQEFSPAFDRDKWQDKFAELIVQECVRYFNEEYQRDFNTLWREDLSKGMKEHFGVESDDDEYDDEVEYCPKCNEEWSGTSCGIDDCGWIVGEEV